MMKRLLLYFLIGLYPFFPLFAFEAKNEQGIVMKFEVISESEKTCRLKGCVTHVKDTLKIPSEIAGYTVTTIGAYSCNQEDMTIIYIPSSIKEIENYSFPSASYSNLMEVHIEDIVAWCQIETHGYGKLPLELAHHLFLNEQEVIDMILPEGLNVIESRAFSGCEGLQSVTIPESVTCIGYDAFENCTNLREVEIWGNITSIRGFSGCANLVSISIPQSVKSIDFEAFMNCNSLTTINIPENVKSIGTRAFYGCSSLVDIHLPTVLSELSSGLFADCVSLKQVAIPDMVENIAESAFKNCSALEYVHIPAGVTSINSRAFSGCSGLRQLTVDENNSWYDSRENCNAIVGKLTDEIIVGCNSTTFPVSVTSIGNYAFEGRKTLTTITIPEGILSIRTCAFQDCSSLSSFSIPSTIVELGSDIVKGCKQMQEITSLIEDLSAIETDYEPWTDAYDCFLFVPKGTKDSYQESSLWKYFSKISEIGIQEELKEGDTFVAETIEGHKMMFTVTNKDSKTCSVGYVVNGSGEHAICSNTTGSVTIPSIANGYTVESITKYAFRDCENIEKASVPNGVSVMDSHAFYNCHSLNSVNIPNDLKEISDYVFYQCEKLSSILIPESVETIGSDAFYGCRSLKTVVLPDRLERIGAHAFHDCSSLTTITIPAGVSEMGEEVFSGCENLSSINLPYSLSYIRYGTFRDCVSLQSIRVPNHVQNIASWAFCGCSGLKELYLGEGLTAMSGEKIFQGCTSLTDLYCYAKNVPETFYMAFSSFDISLVTLHVPAESYSLYRNSQIWSGFKNIIAIEGDTPEARRCATPTICYNEGKILFFSDTDGVEFISSITDEDVRDYFTSSIQLSATYHISVYATKTGYDNSDVAEATLCWLDGSFETEGATTNVIKADAPPVLIKSRDGRISVEGLPDGTRVSVYTTAGTKVGTTVSSHGIASVNTEMPSGTVAIIKAGEKSVKVTIK